MLKNGLNAITRNVAEEYEKLQELDQAKEQRLYWSRRVRRLHEDIEQIREKQFSLTVPNFRSRLQPEGETKQGRLFWVGQI